MEAPHATWSDSNKGVRTDNDQYKYTAEYELIIARESENFSELSQSVSVFFLLFVLFFVNLVTI